MKLKLSTFLITSAIFSSSAMAGDLALGNNSIAMGNAIATGNNTVAIGSGSFASGDNLTPEEVKRRLKENEQKLAEIETQKNKVAQLSKEIEDLRLREQKTIEAGIRVEELQKAKEKAHQEYLRLKQIHDNEVKNSAEFFRQAQAKIDDLNSRLKGIANIDGYDIKNEDDLNKMTQVFKKQVEQGTSLNLSTDFYKTYIKSHYQALGDLRENHIISGRLYSNIQSLTHNPLTGSASNIKIHTMQYSSQFGGFSFGNNEITVNYGHYENQPSYMSFSDRNNSKMNLKQISINTQVMDNKEFESIKEKVEHFHNLAKQQLSQLEEDILTTSEFKQRLQNDVDGQLTLYYKQAQIINAQYNYEQTGNASFLDKKQKLLNEFKQLQNELYKYKKTSTLTGIRQSQYNQWVKENITDIADRNKITTEHLTSELEQALGINRNAIEEKRKEIEKMLKEAEQAKHNWQNINPSEKDLILAKEYEKVKQMLADKSSSLNNANERLTWLKENLTLNTFHQGENATAIGTANLVTGKNATGIGVGNIVANESSVAIGDSNTVTGRSSIAIGSNITMGQDVTNSIALGANSAVGTLITTPTFTFGNKEVTFAGGNAKGVVSVGAVGNERVITNVGAGRISADSTDAINGSQLHGAVEYITTHINNDKVHGNGNGTVQPPQVDIDLTEIYKKMEELDNKILQQSTSHSDKNDNITLNQAINIAKKEDQKVLEQANKHSDLNDQKVLDQANKHSDDNDKKTLEQAKANDNLILSQSKDYTDQEINKLKQNLPINGLNHGHLNQLKAEMKEYTDELHEEALAGVASALATSAIQHIPGKQFSFGAGVGHYKRQNALAIGFTAMHDNRNMLIRVAGTYDSQNNFGGQVGFSFGW